MEVYRHTFPADECDIWVNAGSLDVHYDIVQVLADLGIVEIRHGLIPLKDVYRLEKLLRLRSSLGINIPGAAVILDLLERIERLEAEVDRLKRR